MKNRNTLAGTFLALLFVACVYVFWAIPHRAVLSYHEQFQLFLLGSNYLMEHLAWPGGLATYVAEFLVQFFNNYWIGAAVVALALLAVQLLTWRITCIYSHAFGALRYVLSYLPAIGMWMIMGDVNYLFSYTIALIIVLSAFMAYTALRPTVWRMVFIVVGLPIVYWVAGAIIYLLAALICLDIFMHPGKPYLKGVSAVLVLAYAIMTVFVSTFFVGYPVYQVMIGINYYRLPETITAMMCAAVVVEFITIVFCSVMHGSQKGTLGKYLPAIAAVVLALLAWAGINYSYDARIQELTEYDYLIRTNRWGDIIEKAHQKSPNTPLALCATNFALGMTEQLNNRPFDLYQHGTLGLFPQFQRDANSSLVTAEIFYQLGLINSAQRLTFEAMEAITNYNKSSRCIKRLVETNMIRGDYDVAEKYLKLLDKTLMYRKWAQRTRELIATPGAIDSHPVYGKLRRSQINDDFLFSEIEMDKILGQLYLANNDNILAKQYLVLYPLLQRDLDKFMQYMQVVQGVLPYRPLLCQQGVAFAYVKSGREVPQGLIDAPVLQQLQEFAQTYTSAGKDSPALDRFSNTLWYYLTVRE